MKQTDLEVINNLDSTVTHETDSTAMEKKPMLLCLPYIRGLSESIERSCANLDMKIAFTAKKTLCSLLTNVKGRPTREKVKGVVYKVDCSCGNTYIGETGRTLGVRLKEHKRAVRMDQPNNGIAVHANKTRHDILWDSAEVLEQETNWTKRRFKEALQIQAADKTMNLDTGLQLNPIWSTIRIN